MLGMMPVQHCRSSMSGSHRFLPFAAAIMVALTAQWFSPAFAIDRNAQRASVNNDAVLLIAGAPGSTMMKIADDLAVALTETGGTFRVVPVVGDGAEGNIRDLILLRHVDLGVTDLTALENMKRSKDLSQMLQREVAHVVTLFPDKLQIFASARIKSIKDLDGKTVGVGLRNSSSALHGEAILKSLGIAIKPSYLPALDATEALVNGKIDAFVCFCISSPEIYQRVMFNPDVQLLPIPYDPGVQRDYLPATLAHEEFPSFIGKTQTVQTVAVTLALVTYNWDKSSPRYAQVAKFVELFFDALPRLQQSPRHPGWRSVQISATAGDWPRFAAAAEWKAAQRSDAIQQMRSAFTEFLDRYTDQSSAKIENTDQLKLFEEFLVWRETAQ